MPEIGMLIGWQKIQINDLVVDLASPRWRLPTMVCKAIVGAREDLCGVETYIQNAG
jgi:hypothetical protein